MANKRPNILILMSDQMQGRVLEPDSPCQTPHLDALAARGVRVRRGYTPNAVCSPARASLMTGLLPHNHGVLSVTHCVDDDQHCLREDRPHWAQRLQAAGYRTGYFGKWHVERTGDLGRFGWDANGEFDSPMFKEHAKKFPKGGGKSLLSKSFDNPPGYPSSLFYAVTDGISEERTMGATASLAISFLEEASREDQPFCCFVSVPEPHDPFVATKSFFDRYDPAKLPIPPNWSDGQNDKPGLYRKAAGIFAGLTEKEKRTACACYYASITEIDAQFGRILSALSAVGRLDDTVVVVTADHGELLGAHGLFMKNVGAYEEVYHVPLLVGGPGLARGAAPNSRAGLHDLAPTLLELAGLEPIGAPDSRSFASLLRDPAGKEKEFVSGYAEYSGTRYMLTQRIVWDGDWKLVHNGFDFDELYDLDRDPFEIKNLAWDPAYAERLNAMLGKMWNMMKETKDHSLYNTRYPALRLAARGPGGTIERR